MAGDSLFLAAWKMNKKLPLLIVFLLVLNIGAFFGMRSFVYPRIEDLERRYIERQAELRSLRAEGRPAQGPQNELWQAQEDLSRVWELIPPMSEFTGLIGELFSLADAAGLAINQISYDPKPLENPHLLRYGLTFSVFGDYSQVKRFVYSLEQSERLVAIEDIALSSARESEAGQVNLNLRLSTLFKTGDL